MSVFGPGYAAVYDAVYGDKDYERECDLLEELFARYAGRPVREVLDLGCGTGGHAVPLAGRGYGVTGVERSPEMLEIARRKAGDAVELRAGDLRTVRLGRELDAVLMMFAVLGYQLEDADVGAALETARSHLRPGGILVFDVWYGPAVLAQRPSSRRREAEDGGRRVERSAASELDMDARRVAVTFHVRSFEGGRLVGETEERHEVRFFFRHELELLLEAAGLELVRLGAFPEVDRDPDESTWNVVAVARRPSQ